MSPSDFGKPREENQSRQMIIDDVPRPAGAESVAAATADESADHLPAGQVDAVFETDDAESAGDETAFVSYDFPATETQEEKKIVDGCGGIDLKGSSAPGIIDDLPPSSLSDVRRASNTLKELEEIKSNFQRYFVPETPSGDVTTELQAPDARSQTLAATYSRPFGMNDSAEPGARETPEKSDADAASPKKEENATTPRQETKQSVVADESDSEQTSSNPDTAENAQDESPPQASHSTKVASANENKATLRKSLSFLDQTTDELDLWWGSYSGWGMTTSWLMCFLFTVAFGWACWKLAPPQYFRLIFFGIGGAVWLVQVTRWLYRVFGFNYRLTTRRLYIDRGWLYSAADRLDLSDVKKVSHSSSFWGVIFRYGSIIVDSKDVGKPPIVLDAVRDSKRLVKQIENSVNLAQER